MNDPLFNSHFLSFHFGDLARPSRHVKSSPLTWVWVCHWRPPSRRGSRSLHLPPLHHYFPTPHWRRSNQSPSSAGGLFLRSGVLVILWLMPSGPTKEEFVRYVWVVETTKVTSLSKSVLQLKQQEKKALDRTVTNIVAAWSEENDVCSTEKLGKKDGINLNFVQNQWLDWDGSVLNTCVYMCVCVVCLHIYTNVGFSFYFGKVKWVTLRVKGKTHGLSDCSPGFWDSCPSHHHGLSPLWLLLYQNLASVTEQSNSHGSSYYNDSSGVSSFPGEQRHRIK